MNNVQVEELKHKILSALFSRDILFEYLVLKGGNAISMIYQLITRASFDLDFSMAGDFPGGKEELKAQLESALKEGMSDSSYEVFDVVLSVKPKSLSEEKADFWGGYECAFKLVDKVFYHENSNDISKLRRNAVVFGGKARFFIDISRHEYIESKVISDVGDIVLYSYTPVMLVCEKLRAICQQTEGYKELFQVKVTARSRDFYDITLLVTMLSLDIATKENFDILRAIFEAKRVPIKLLDVVKDTKEFHEADFISVRDTVLSDIELKDFDYYFNFVVELIESLKSFWNK